DAIAGKGQIVISSSDANQRSWESKRYKNGVFTRSLIQVLEKNKEATDTDLSKAFDTLKDSVQSEVRFDRQAFQTPVMHSHWEGDPLRLTAKPAAPREVFADKKHPFVYEIAIKKPDSPPPKKLIQKPVATTTQAQPSQLPTQTPAQTQPQVQVQTQVKPPTIIYQNDPTATPVKPIVVPAGKEADLWFKFKNRPN
ncbi:MAG: caspase family protein, partial [Cyanobacteriota/Melainabacteria group bacterium]